MATFSTNQSRHLYVAKAMSAVAEGVNPGTIEVKADAAKTHLYFKYMSPGGQIRTDLIDIKNIAYAKATDADSLAHAMARYKVALDPSVNSGNPVASEDYILNLNIYNFIGVSEEDQYLKQGFVRGITGMTPEQFYLTLLDSLNKNFSRETTKLLNFSLETVKASAVLSDNAGITVTAKTGGTIGNSIKFEITSVTAGANAATVTTVAGVTTISVALTGASATIGALKSLISNTPAANALVTIAGTDATAVVVESPAVALTGGATTGLIIEEAEQPWVLGTMQVTFTNFSVHPRTIMVSGEERVWGLVTKLESVNKIENGKIIADMEYFYMGERGDQFRNIGWPNVIKTNYLADSTLKYNTIDINYAFQGPAEDIQKSPRTITLVVPKVGATNNVSNALANSIIEAINTATDLSIPTLAV